jgi:hypothetical protein
MIFKRKNRGEQYSPNSDSGSELYHRVRTFGTGGIVEVESVEGQSMRPEDVKYLVPAGLGRASLELLATEDES